MILQPSDAQNSSFLHFFWSFKKYTQKVMPKDAGICIRKGYRPSTIAQALFSHLLREQKKSVLTVE